LRLRRQGDLPRDQGEEPLKHHRIQGLLGGVKLAVRIATVALVVVIVGLFLYIAFELYGIGLTKYSVAFVGLSLLFSSVALFLIWKPGTKVLLVFQLTMGLGLFMSLQSFLSSTPFASEAAFTIGSLAMVVTTTFYIKRDDAKFYKELLTVSTVSAFFLILAGIFGEVNELTAASGISVPTSSVYANIVSSLFLLGSIDLGILGVYMFRFAVSEGRWGRLTGESGPEVAKEGSEKKATEGARGAQSSPSGQPKTLYVKFYAPVDYNSANALMALVEDRMKQGYKRFVILLSSAGGNVFHGLTLFNFLKGVPVEIETHNIGSVDSVTAVIFCAGKKRYSVPNGRILLHGVSTQFPANTVLEEQQLVERLKGLQIDSENIAKVLAATSGKTVEQIVKAMLDRTTLNPEQAREFGLVHEIKSELFPEGAELVTISQPQ
jgi:ATP-dependent Clp protease, protease subunit